jgi:DHA3 family macrolide efflux protein-like MFS transporter
MNRLMAARSFLLVWAGQLVSSVGSALSSFALGLWVLRSTGSTTLFAMTFIATTIPSILVSPFAGAVVDRLDRRRIMMSCDALSAASIIALAGLLATGRLAVWHIYVVAGSTSLLDSFRSPAFSASVPLIAKRDQLPRANAMVQSGRAAASIFGPLLAGVLVNSIAFRGVLLVDALTFLVGMVTLAGAKIPYSSPARGDNGSDLLQEAATGWRYIQSRSGLLGLLGLFGFTHFAFAVADVLIAPLLLSFSTPEMVGLQFAISGCGLLVGGLVMTALGGLAKQMNGVLLFTALGGICLAAHGVRPSFVLIAATGFVLFATLPVIDASSTSLWQSKVPTYLQGRCFAIRQLLLNFAMTLGYCLAGPLSDYVCEPLLRKGGLLANSVGSVIGVGQGRGIGLMFIILGASMTAVALKASSVPAIRELDELEDALSSSEGIVFAESNSIDEVVDSVQRQTTTLQCERN